MDELPGDVLSPGHDQAGATPVGLHRQGDVEGEASEAQAKHAAGNHHLAVGECSERLALTAKTT